MTWPTRPLALVGAGLLVVAAAVAVLVLGGSSARGAATPAETQSRALTVAPALGDADTSPRYPADGGARAAAAVAIARIPLPDGGNVNGVRWERSGGDLSGNDIEVVLEYNAVCQWTRSARDGRDRAVALSVLADAPRWPAFRDRPAGEVIARVAAEARAGGGHSFANVAVDCDASHAREVAYALSLSLAPSS